MQKHSINEKVEVTMTSQTSEPLPSGTVSNNLHELVDIQKPIPPPRKRPAISPKPILESSLSMLSNRNTTNGDTKPSVSAMQATATGNKEVMVQSPDCDLCSKTLATFFCSTCDTNKFLCDGCDCSWHAHVKRRQHKRHPLPQPKPRQLGRANRCSVVIFHGKRGSGASNEDQDVSGRPQTENLHGLPFKELNDKLEGEHDLSKRMDKVVEMLQNIECRLGGIKYGLEVIGVKERIRMLKEQTFLTNYHANLSNKIRESKIGKNEQLPEACVCDSRKDSPHRRIMPNTAKNLKREIPVPVTHNPSDYEDIYVEDTPISEESPSSEIDDGNDSAYEYVEVGVLPGSQEIPMPAGSGYSSAGRKSDGRQVTDDNKIYHSAEYSIGQCSREIWSSISNEVYNSFDPPQRPSQSFSVAPSSPKPKPRMKKSASLPNSSTDSWKTGWPQPWECEHCTFHNVQGSRVCVQCCRTSDNPVLLEGDVCHRDLPSPPPLWTMSSTGKSDKVLDQLDNLAIMQRHYSESAQSSTHGELLAKLDGNLQSGKGGIHYDRSQQRSSILRLASSHKDDPTFNLLNKLKEADKAYFTVEEFEIANQLSGDTDPSQWLKTVWNSLVDTVISSVNVDLKSIEPAAQLSKEEARLALIQASGDANRASGMASATWKQQYEELLTNVALPNLPTKDEKDLVVSAMNESHGDLAKASLELFKPLKSLDMLNHIWQEEDSQNYTNYEKFISDKSYHLVADEKLPKMKRVHILMSEFKLDTVDKAKSVLLIWKKRQSLSESVTLADVIEAVRNCGNVMKALSYIQQDCAICARQFPASKILMLSFCQCKMCIECFKQYFVLVIREKPVRHMVCPKCGKPDVNNREEFEQHLQLLLLMLKKLLSKEDVYLFEKKLTDWSLMEDPNFRWCSYDDCGCGFIFIRQQPGDLIMECPECSRKTCFGCKRPWEDQHAGQTCEEFARIKSWRVPAKPTVDAANLIQDWSIDCPRCHYSYAIAKGGCIHFTCSRCHHEFCSGCNKTFYRGEECTFLETCANLGLHCHHPRSCLYYLRSEPVDKLKKLLLNHGISFLVDDHGTKKQKTCPVIEQKDLNKDEPCRKTVLKNHAGLCEPHYKEYLITLINQYNIDPVNVMTEEELKTQFLRIGNKAPERNTGESRELYRNRLVTLVKQQMPLPTLRRSSILTPRS